jgi:hypothetical protein
VCFLGLSLGAGATLSLRPELLGALQQSRGSLIQRAIPSSGEMLPVIGLQFGNPPPPNHAALREVLKTLVANGGRFLDAVHQSASAEEVTATVATGGTVTGLILQQGQLKSQASRVR